MVKINYNWNAETSNTEPHADNDGGSVRKKKVWEREGGRDLELVQGRDNYLQSIDYWFGGALRSISAQLCPYQYPDRFMRVGKCGLDI